MFYDRDKEIVATQVAVCEVEQVQQQPWELPRQEQQYDEQDVLNQQVDNVYGYNQEVVVEDQVVVQDDYREQTEQIYQQETVDQQVNAVVYNEEVDYACQPRNQEIGIMESQQIQQEEQIDVDVEQITVADQQVVEEQVEQPVFQEQIVVEQPVYQEEVVVQQPFYQEEVVIDQPVYQEEVYVEQPVYQEDVVVDQAVYQEDVVVDQAVYQEDVVVDQAVYQEDVVVDQAVYQEDVVVDQAVYQEKVVIDQPVYQEEVVVEQSVYQEEVVVEQPAYQEVVIDQPVYQEDDIVDQAVYKEDVVVDQAVYQEDVVIDQPVYQEEIVVEKPFYQEEVVVEQTVYSEEVVVEQPVYQQEVVVEQQFYQEEVVVEQPVYQEQVVVEQPVYGEDLMLEQPFYDEQIVYAEQNIYEDNVVVVQQPVYQEQIVLQKPDERVFIPAPMVFVQQTSQNYPERDMQVERFDTVQRFTEEDLQLRRQAIDAEFDSQRLLVLAEMQKINRKKQMMDVLGVEDARMLERERLLNQQNRNLEEIQGYKLDRLTPQPQYVEIAQQEVVIVPVIAPIVQTQIVAQQAAVPTQNIQSEKQQPVVNSPTKINPPIQIQATDSLMTMESEAYYHSFFEWKKAFASIENNIFKLPEKQIPIIELSKIKAIKDPAVNDTMKIKLTHFTNSVFFAVNPATTFEKVSLHYFWFAKLTTMKLELAGHDLKNAYIPEQKYTNKNVKEAFIDGIIYKKSQHLSKWELRYVAITPMGLFSYKDETSSESFTIKRGSVSEVWTRFDIHEKMLVIKVHYSTIKTEFAIPLTNYCFESNINWLYPFYRLMYQT